MVQVVVRGTRFCPGGVAGAGCQEQDRETTVTFAINVTDVNDAPSLNSSHVVALEEVLVDRMEKFDELPKANAATFVVKAKPPSPKAAPQNLRIRCPC